MATATPITRQRGGSRFIAASPACTLNRTARGRRPAEADRCVSPRRLRRASSARHRYDVGCRKPCLSHKARTDSPLLACLCTMPREKVSFSRSHIPPRGMPMPRLIYGGIMAGTASGLKMWSTGRIQRASIGPSMRGRVVLHRVQIRTKLIPCLSCPHMPVCGPCRIRRAFPGPMIDISICIT